MFYEKWLEKKIWSGMQLLDNTGNIVTFDDFRSKFNIFDKRPYTNVE